MDIPSLFMIPSAVSSGKVHSVFPNSTDADFDFNRDSSATRVNSQGLIETVGYFGSELVTNGTFDNNLNNWNLTLGGQTVEWENGKVRIITDGTFASLQQSITTVVGKVYRARVDIDVTSGNLALNVGGAQVFGNGKRTLELFFTATGTSTTFQLKRYSGAESSNGTFDNATFVEVQGDRARLNYEIEGGLVNTKPSLLLEPQSTNKIPYSEDFSQSDWVKGNTSITKNIIKSPDGTVNAHKLVEDSSNSYHKLDDTITVSSGATVTCSVFVKKAERDFILLFESQSADGAYFNLNTGAFVRTDGSPNSYNSENYGNGWYRLSITTTVPSTSCRFQIYVTETSATTVYQGNSSSGVYLWGAMVEELSYPTSYIPTNGSTQTRAAETCNGAGTSSILPSEEGILYTEIAALSSTDPTHQNRDISISDGTINNTLILYYQSSLNRISVYINVGNVMVALGSVTSYTVTNFNKIAVRWKQNDFRMYINGTLVFSDTSGASFSSGTLNRINFDNAIGNDDFYGKIRDIRVYNTKEMTDSEVDILLTKITS